MGDYREIERQIQIKVNAAYHRGYNDGLVAKQKISLCGKCDSLNEALDRGRDEAWELAQKIVLDEGGFDYTTLKEIFNGESDSYYILEHYAPQEALKKVKAWEDKQKQDATDIDDGSIEVGEEMHFPNTWEEFEKQYGFSDINEVYTNGVMLIPTFRVKQYLDHIETKGAPDTNETSKKEYVWHFRGFRAEPPFECPKCKTEARARTQYCPECGQYLHGRSDE